MSFLSALCVASRLGLPRTGGGEALLELKGAHVLLPALVKRGDKGTKHLHKGVPGVRRGPTGQAGAGMPLTQILLSLAILAFLGECHNQDPTVTERDAGSRFSTQGAAQPELDGGPATAGPTGPWSALQETIIPIYAVARDKTSVPDLLKEASGWCPDCIQF